MTRNIQRAETINQALWNDDDHQRHVGVSSYIRIREQSYTRIDDMIAEMEYRGAKLFGFNYNGIKYMFTLDELKTYESNGFKFVEYACADKEEQLYLLGVL